jgi:hypothetical protein
MQLIRFGKWMFVPALLLVLVGTVAGKGRPKDYPPYPWSEVGKADWDVVADSSKGIFSAAMIFERVFLNDSNMFDGNCVRTLYRRVRILNSDGRSNADVDVPFVSTAQHVVDIQGRTILPDGTIIPLAKNQIMEKSVVRAKGVKVNQKSFSLPGVTDNCVIEYVVRYELVLEASNWQFQANIPLLKGQLHWYYKDLSEERQKLKDMLATFGFRMEDFLTRNFTWQHMETNRSSRLVPPEKPVEYLFEVNNVPAYKSEPIGPSDELARSALILYYGSERLPIVYWSGKSGDLKSFIAMRADSCGEAKKVAAGLDTTVAGGKISAAYAWVQKNIVNMSFPDLPAPQALIKARPALESKGADGVEKLDDLFKHKYGSKEDINLAFIAILRAMGVPAKGAAITDRTETEFLKEAKYWQFDDYCVAIPDSAGNFRFYSPGEPFLACGSLPWFNEGGKALIEGPEGKIVPIPYSESKLTQLIRQCQYVMGTDFAISGSVSSRLGGQRGRRIRMELLNEEEKQRDAALRKMLADDYPNLTFDSLKTEYLDADDHPLQVAYQVTFPAVAPQGDRLMLNPFDYLSTAASPFEATERKMPVYFSYAYQANESAQLSIPVGWKIEALPHDTLWANPAGKCGFHVQESGDGLSVQRIFVLNTPYWSVENYPAVRELFQKRQDLSHAVVVLTKAQ